MSAHQQPTVVGGLFPGLKLLLHLKMSHIHTAILKGEMVWNCQMGKIDPQLLKEKT